jgi:hypothetical protein
VPKSVHRSLLRLSIRAGEIAVRGSRLVRIETRLADGQVRVEDLATGEFDEVPIADLRARSSTANGVSIDAPFHALVCKSCGGQLSQLTVSEII